MNGRCVEVNNITFVVGIVPDTETYLFLVTFIRTGVTVDVVEVDPS